MNKILAAFAASIFVTSAAAQAPAPRVPVKDPLERATTPGTVLATETDATGVPPKETDVQAKKSNARKSTTPKRAARIQKRSDKVADKPLN